MLTTGVLWLQGFVKSLSRDAAADAPMHDRIQRLLVAAALQPLCTVDEADQQHPLQSLLELLLSLPTMAAPSPAVRDGRIRFAAHFGLALVSLNAMPGNPGGHHCLRSSMQRQSAPAELPRRGQLSAEGHCWHCAHRPRLHRCQVPVAHVQI